jgi:hypothetical protein
LTRPLYVVFAGMAAPALSSLCPAITHWLLSTRAKVF